MNGLRAAEAPLVPTQTAHDLTARYALTCGLRPRAGRPGDTLGRGLGTSLEFSDRRAYLPGDDLRTVDWQAYARTDQLMVRLYTEQVTPRVEVLLDASRSMAIDESKARAALDLATFLILAARAAGAAQRLVVLDDAPHELDPDALLAHGVAFSGRRPLHEGLTRAAPRLRAGALRVVISDFLEPTDARSLLARVGGGAGRLVLVQCLAPDEADPGAELGPTRLVDVEGDAALDLVLDASAVARYRARLATLQDGLREQARRFAGCFAVCVGGDGPDAVCSGPLVIEGVLQPR